METGFCEVQSSKGNYSKIYMQELPFLHKTHRLMFINICMKFREDILRGFQVTERTRFVTDRRTDGRTYEQTGARGKTICLPALKGGDIITRMQGKISLDWT